MAVRSKGDIPSPIEIFKRVKKSIYRQGYSTFQQHTANIICTQFHPYTLR
ncbi:hypothetical protein BRADI_2g23022v3 [Brachypodium distachyon]|uniref:Uncharacterized protein n=1 Tax=Brachypodium distachyon TaxID=15368 RepID=A0A2K2D9Y7_BRADI|nr:hypothetical protein BRADI_2g23022v3 [Brachypodium distachyon]